MVAAGVEAGDADVKEVRVVADGAEAAFIHHRVPQLSENPVSAMRASGIAFLVAQERRFFVLRLPGRMKQFSPENQAESREILAI